MTKHILVIGAGIIGASLAYHLTATGCAVTIVDRGKGGGVATGGSFAWINATWGNPERYSHFRRRSMAGWRRLQREVPGIVVDWCGGLLWDLPPDEMAAYAEQHGRWGYGLRRVDRTEAARIEPGLKDPPEIALHVAEEGAVEPVAAADALLAAALDRGARFMPEFTVASIRRQGQRWRVEASDGRSMADTDELVVAAGIGTAALLAKLGSTLRIDAPPGLVVHTTPADNRLLNGLVLAPDVHVRQSRGGRLVAGADFGGGNPAGDGKKLARDLMERLKALVRGAEKLELDFVTVESRPTPADGFPAVGRVDEGLYVAVLHSGITLAPIVGELAAREIETGDRDPDLEPYDPRRSELA